MSNQECLMNIRAYCGHLRADLEDLSHYVDRLDARPAWETMAREELAQAAAAAQATLHTILQKQIQFDNLPVIHDPIYLKQTGT